MYLTKADIRELDAMYKENVKEELLLFEQIAYNNKMKLRLQGQFVWYPLEVKYINGYPCLAIKYLRKGIDGQVFVQKYNFFLKGKSITFILSYRYSEKEKWANDFEKLAETIKIKQ